MMMLTSSTPQRSASTPTSGLASLKRDHRRQRCAPDRDDAKVGLRRRQHVRPQDKARRVRRSLAVWPGWARKVRMLSSCRLRCWWPFVLLSAGLSMGHGANQPAYEPYPWLTDGRFGWPAATRRPGVRDTRGVDALTMTAALGWPPRGWMPSPPAAGPRCCADQPGPGSQGTTAGLPTWPWVDAMGARRVRKLSTPPPQAHGIPVAIA